MMKQTKVGCKLMRGTAEDEANTYYVSTSKTVTVESAGIIIGFIQNISRDQWTVKRIQAIL